MNKRLRNPFHWFCLIFVVIFSIDAFALSKTAEIDVSSCEKVQKEDRTDCREQRRMEIEVAKLRQDQEKIDNGNAVEYWKSAISTLGIAVPLIGVILAAIYTRKNLIEEKRLDREVRTEDERFQFQLKAAEIAMNAENSVQVRTKALILAKLFPQRLPENFAADLNPELLRFGPGGPSFKVDLLKLLAAYPDQKESILRYWGAVFPGDRGWKSEDHKNYNWFNELEKELRGDSEPT